MLRGGIATTPVRLTNTPKTRASATQNALKSAASRKEISLASRWRTKRSNASIRRMKALKTNQAHTGNVVNDHLLFEAILAGFSA